MRAVAGQSARVARVVFAPVSVGEGWAMGTRWVLSLARWWWTVWLKTAARLAEDPSTFVNHR